VQDADPSRSDISADSPYNSKIMAWFNLTYPNGNEIFTINQPCVIQWDYLGSGVPNVRLDISKNDFVNTTAITANTPNDGIYNEVNWTMPDMATVTAKVRVMAVGDTDAFDASDNYFKIRGAFNMSYPVDGARMPIGYNATLIWNTTGTINNVRLIAYSTDGLSDPRFPYTLASPYTIEANYTGNVPNGQTNYTWLVPDNATDKLRVRVIDINDPEVYAESSGNASMVGTFNVTSPNGGESWIVGSYHNITWIPTGSSIDEALITYSLNNMSGPWLPIQETWDIPNDGIVNNNGTYLWQIPDTLTKFALVKVSDPYDNLTYDTSNSTFKIIGNIIVMSPAGGERWVTYDNKTITWNSTGSVNKVNIMYSRDNFNTSNTVVTNYTATAGVNNYIWQIPDPLSVYQLNATALPIAVKLRIQDANDTDTYNDSLAFNFDYYNITWYIRDFLTNLPIGGGLQVNDSSGWAQTSLATPVFHKTPYGAWAAVWSHKDYGEYTEQYVADSDQNFTVYLESKIVHVWEAATEYVYDPEHDKLSFSATLIRDGSVVTGANNCTIDIFNIDGAGTNMTLSQGTPDSAGFFSLVWNNTNLNTSRVYNARTKIENAIGGQFRTPFLITLATSQAIYNMTTEIATKIDVPLSVIQANLLQEMSNQTGIIENKTDIMVQVIQNASSEMQVALNTTLVSFEQRTYSAIADLQAGANQTLVAADTAVAAASTLEATAKKFSWSADVAPNPALTGDTITLSCQGQPGYSPSVSIYSWDNKLLISDQYMLETQLGLYVYEFTADSRFTVGKAYTYIIQEPQTGGLVTGSGVVESMTITTVAGLAAAAPEAERAAKKALDAIKAVEAVVVSSDNINIALTLKNLKDSVDALPEVLAKDITGGGAVSKAVNDIADKLKALGLEEGFDFEEMLEKAIGDSPTIKEVRSKTDAINGVVQILLQIFEAKFGGLESPIVSTSLSPGSVRFRVVAVNPSKTKTQVVQVKSYLPEEVRPKDILDLGALELEYDAEKSIYYVYKGNVELAPSEVRVFEVEVEDIWMIPQEKLDDFRSRVEAIMERLEDTEYYSRAKEIADTIAPRLEEIARTQADETVSRAQHIGYYRQNILTVDSIKEDIAKLEKILATAGGPLAPEMLAKTRIKSESPSKTMTWVVIFSIIIFIGLMAGVLFFTWHRQTRITREELLAAKKTAFPEPSERPESHAEEPTNNP